MYFVAQYKFLVVLLNPSPPFSVIVIDIIITTDNNAFNIPFVQPLGIRSALFLIDLLFLATWSQTENELKMSEHGLQSASSLPQQIAI